jgi:hypothetical protein
VVADRRPEQPDARLVRPRNPQRNAHVASEIMTRRPAAKGSSARRLNSAALFRGALATARKRGGAVAAFRAARPGVGVASCRKGLVTDCECAGLASRVEVPEAQGHSWMAARRALDAARGAVRTLRSRALWRSPLLEASRLRDCLD